MNKDREVKNKRFEHNLNISFNVSIKPITKEFVYVLLYKLCYYKKAQFLDQNFIIGTTASSKAFAFVIKVEVIMTFGY